MMRIRVPVPSRTELEDDYNRYADLFEKAVYEVQKRIRGFLQRAGLHPTIKYRVKNFDSYYHKMLRRVSSTPKGEDWFTITDVLGIRVVCPFMSDLPIVEDVLTTEFEVVEREKKGAEFSFKEFGYDSLHYLIKLPQDVQDFYRLPETMVCEVQLRTILQDAWAEVEHELVYKSDYTPFDESLRRKLAALNANLSLADMVFHEIREYQRELNRQLKKRRSDFWTLVRRSEEVHHKEMLGAVGDIVHDTSKALTPPIEPESNVNGPADQASESNGEESPHMPHYDVVDGQLLKAIYAHNEHRYTEAVQLYSEILSLSPRAAVRDIVLVHRGMAYFALENYPLAIDDFSASMELEGDHRKALYYRAVANRQVKNYQNSLSDLDQCLLLDPYQPEVLLSRAQTRAQLGDFSAALNDADAALSINPEDQDTISFRKMLARKVSDT